MKTPILATICAATAACCSMTSAQMYDLAEEFSYASNPFGYWNLYKAPGSLHTVVQPDYFQDGHLVRAWADQPWPQPLHVPFWMKVEQATSQTQIGDVTVHTAELDRTFTQVTMVTWTAPTSCRVYVSGMIWAPTGNNRVNGWQLRTNATSSANGTLVTSGLLVSDGSTMRETAQRFLDPLAGDGPLIRELLAGESVALWLVSLSDFGNLGDTLALNLRVQRNPKVISGVVALEDYTLDPSHTEGRISLVSQTSGLEAWSSSISFAPNGAYTAVAPGNLPAGMYRVVLKGSHWLASTAGVVSSDPADHPGMNATLVNGDCDGDNEVGPGDFGALSSAFGSTDGDSNWNPDGDLDGDGEVGPSDFGILSANFGLAGE